MVRPYNNFAYNILCHKVKSKCNKVINMMLNHNPLEFFEIYRTKSPAKRFYYITVCCIEYLQLEILEINKTAIYKQMSF